MLVLRSTPQGRRYYEFRSHFASKNHQGGLTDNPDESDGKMFEVPNSKRCPVKTLESFLKHLNPNLQALFQRPREVSTKFQPQKDEVWYCNSPVGKSTLENMMKNMSTSAGIAPHLKPTTAFELHQLQCCQTTTLKPGILRRSLDTNQTIPLNLTVPGLPFSRKRTCQAFWAASSLVTRQNHEFLRSRVLQHRKSLLEQALLLSRWLHKINSQRWKCKCHSLSAFMAAPFPS